MEKLGLAEYEVKMHDLGVEHLSDIQVSEVDITIVRCRTKELLVRYRTTN